MTPPPSHVSTAPRTDGRATPATTAATINLQTDKASIGPNDGSQTTQQQVKLTATVRDAANNLVKGKTIRFRIRQDNSGGSLTSSTATTDSLGKASTTYVSSSATTAKDGVIIRAEVTEGTNTYTSDATLTVAQISLFVRLGAGNKITAVNASTYAYPFTVIVTDASGNAVQNADVGITVVPAPSVPAAPSDNIAFRKGMYYWDTVKSLWVILPRITDPITGNYAGGVNAVCSNEDLNQNGILDLTPSTEDTSGNGKLDPGNVASAPQSVTTGTDGTIQFDVTYPKQYANWVRVMLTASRKVAGTESLDSIKFYLPVDGTDVSSQSQQPPGAVSPFGFSSSCSDVL